MQQISTIKEMKVPVEENEFRWWQMVWGIVRHPYGTFRQLKNRGNLLLPAFLMISCTAFSGISLLISQHSEIIAELHHQFVNIPPEQLNKVIAVSTSPAVLSIAVSVAIIGTLVGWFLQSGLYHVLILALGKESIFRQSFTVVGWSWTPLCIEHVITGTYSLITGKIPATLGKGLVYAFFNNTTFFTFWSMLLMIIGFSLIYEMDKKKAAIMVIGLWVTTVLVSYYRGPITMALKP